jgi:6-phosphogluconolactonase (cycloisomerase 2 family)
MKPQYLAVALLVALVATGGSANDNYLFVSNESGGSKLPNETRGNVSTYAIGEGGALIPVPERPVPAGTKPVSVAVEPWGRFACVANCGGSNNVSGYRIAANGSLNPIPGSPYPTGNLPWSVTVDPTGRYVYVVNEGAQNVCGFKIGADGALSKVPNSPFPVGTDPRCAVVEENGRYAYVVNAATSSISAFEINSVSSNMSAFRVRSDLASQPLPGSPFSAELGPFGLACKPGVR